MVAATARVQRSLKSALERFAAGPAGSPKKQASVAKLAKELDGFAQLTPARQRAFVERFSAAVGAGERQAAAWREQLGRAGTASLGFEVVERQPLLASLQGALEPVKTHDVGPAAVPAQIAGVKVQSARVVSFAGLQGDAKLMQQGTVVSFGKLSRAQFDALSAEFGGLTRAGYDAGRTYTAVDFLPPALQALAFKDYDAAPRVTLQGTARLRELDEGDYRISVSPNCHGTAWEAMRAYQGSAGSQVSIFYGDAMTADAEYQDSGKFLPVGGASLEKLKPGDCVAFYPHATAHDGGLLHSAVYVGGSLFFEKPDTELDDLSETPYRLSTYAQLVAPIADYLGGEQPKAAALRPRAALEPGEKAFAFNDDGKLEAWAKKKGAPLGRPLVTELELGMGGGVRGIHASAVDALPV